jgi:hypothetical protein
VRARLCKLFASAFANYSLTSINVVSNQVVPVASEMSERVPWSKEAGFVVGNNWLIIAGHTLIYTGYRRVYHRGGDKRLTAPSLLLTNESWRQRKGVSGSKFEVGWKMDKCLKMGGRKELYFWVLHIGHMAQFSSSPKALLRSPWAQPPSHPAFQRLF